MIDGNLFWLNFAEPELKLSKRELEILLDELMITIGNMPSWIDKHIANCKPEEVDFYD